MDWNSIASHLIPTVLAAGGGGAVVATVMRVTGRIVLELGKQELESEAKRTKAIASLYKQLPILARIVPRPVLAKIIEVVWHELVKPALMAPPPPKR